jgi:predicted nucleic acid-binding protein
VAVGRHHRGPQALRLYVDSSAFAKVLTSEPGAHELLAAWHEADDVICVTIGYVELRAAIARRLAPRAQARARRLLDGRWQDVQTVTVDAELVRRAARVADTHRLRALDALHLAAAERIREPGLVFATWDAELERAARDAGFATLP